MTLTLLQLADSAFPTGGFAHSGGIEALMQAGHLRDEAQLRARLVELVHSVAGSMLPFLDAAHAGLAEEADRGCDAFLTNHVAHRASRAQGAAFLLAAGATFGARLTLEHAHLPVAMGAVLAREGIALDDARRLLLFGALRSALSAAVRLGCVGPLRAQALLHSLHGELEAALEETRGLAMADARSTAPVLDLCQARHDAAYSRLFQS
jgi:urease accessory protein